ncbi:MAG: conserved phage C-terminal domain-containing protein [Deltaproteobacteria bacterium]|jgi:uncharacterized phage protein (TIGR02220 family)|nr:conserved phage C-terminal domain-containing protein [Deltaproteobacteria bacterium]
METEIKTDAADLSKKYFFIISNELIDHCKDLKINSVQLHLLLTVIRHAYQNDSAYPSILTLNRKTGLSRPAIILNLRKLEEKGYIVKTHQFRDNKGKSNNLYSFKPLNNILDRLIKGENIQDILTHVKEINLPCKGNLHTHVKEINLPCKGNLHTHVKEINLPCKGNLHTHVKEINPNNIYKNNTYINNTNKNKTKDDADKSALILDSTKMEILNYLNLKTGKSFSYKNQNNLKNISARLKEGYTALQLKTVIDKKSSEWLNDEKMNQYLNPETLFRPKKFEIYLNSKPPGMTAQENKYANVKTTHIDNITGATWVTGG